MPDDARGPRRSGEPPSAESPSAGSPSAGSPSAGSPSAGSPSVEPLCDEARQLTARLDALADPDGPADDPPRGARDDDHDEIVQLLRRALAAGEWSAPGLLASAHLRRGRRRDAAEVLSPAVMVGGHPELAGVLGETLATLGDHDHAEQAFLVGLDAGDPVTMNDYGVFLRDRGRTQEATYVLDLAVGAGDELAPLNLVALHLEELDDLVAATALAEDLRDEAKPTTLVALADVRLAAGRLDDAEALYRRASELGAACAHIYLGWFLQDRRGDMDGAEDHLRQAYRAREPGAAHHLGRFLHDAGRLDEAQPWLEIADAGGDQDAHELLEAEYRGLVDQYDD